MNLGLKKTWISLAVATFVLAGCGGGGAGQGEPRPSACTNRLEGTVTARTELSPTGAECDYLLAGDLKVRGELVILPGTYILAAEDASIQVEVGGSVIASGTEAAPIRIIGATATQGFWEGVCFGNGHLESRFDHVELAWAGQRSAALHCQAAIAGLAGAAAPVHVTYSQIYGSAASGVNATEFPLGDFHHNVLAANGDYGLRVSPNNMSRLDATTVYGGADLGVPGVSGLNGKPFVYLDSGELDEPGIHDWVPLDVPYLVTGDDAGYSGTAVRIGTGAAAILTAGTEIAFGEGTQLAVSWEGSLGLAGEADNNVRLYAAPGAAGWDGVWVAGGRLLALHAEVADAGHGTLMQGAVSFRNPSGGHANSHLCHVTIRNPATNGIEISDPYAPSVRLDAMSYVGVKAAYDEVIGTAEGPAVYGAPVCP